jgi:hypothetical protein
LSPAGGRRRIEQAREPQQAGINEALFGEALKLQSNDPKQDSRMPDIIVKPLVGIFYASKASNKIAEHGGFNTDPPAPKRRGTGFTAKL